MQTFACALRRALTVVLAATVLLGAGAVGAFAATLNNGGSPIAIVIPNGTTFTVQLATALMIERWPMIDGCYSVSLSGTVVNNGAGNTPITFDLAPTRVTSCTLPTSVQPAFPWTVRIDQGGPPWGGTGNMQVTITHAGSVCTYLGSGPRGWVNDSPSWLSFHGRLGAFSIPPAVCPAPATVDGVFEVTRVDYMFSPTNMVIS